MSRQMQKRRGQLVRRLPAIEQLEERYTPAQFGVPWLDSAHLTLSFAPDGTLSAGEPSELHASLDAQMPRAVWQDAILQAAQSWSEVANVNIGLREDTGIAFGAAGRTQADPRFGDLRIGGFPMANTELAVAVPPSTTVSGSLAGDVFFNTAATFNRDQLYAVALHEIGHSLGLAHSSNPNSVMFSHLNTNTRLAPSDVAAIRSLYGPRGLDLNEPNNSLSRAGRIKYSQVSGNYDGSTPVVAYGDIQSPMDVDYFQITVLSGYTGPMTFRVQTNGISLLAPKVSLLDRTGRVLDQSTSTALHGDTISLQLPRVGGAERYYVRVEAAPEAGARVGRYGIGVTFDDRLQPTPITLNEVLRGAYETLSPERVDQLFKSPALAIFDDDAHTNDTARTPVNLRPGLGQTSDRDLSVVGSLSDPTDVDFYRVKSPTAGSGQTWVMTATLWKHDLNGVLPEVRLYDNNLADLNARVVVNGNGTYTVQAEGVPPNRTAYLRVASPDGQPGNYVLHVTFGNAAAELNRFAAGTLANGNSNLSYKLYVGRSQLFSFLLGSSPMPGNVGVAAPVNMIISDANGNSVYQLTTPAGKLSSNVSALLTPGEYTVTFQSSAPTAFTLQGSALTDPIGPVIDSAIYAPAYVVPGTSPPRYKYPTVSTTVTSPYFWLLVI